MCLNRLAHPRRLRQYCALVRLFCYAIAMDRGRSEVQCIVREGELVVLLPGDDFCAVYHKPTTHPQLILKRRTQTEDYVVLARAWQAANDKARELGWIR